MGSDKDEEYDKQVRNILDGLVRTYKAMYREQTKSLDDD
jgi:hypothetical protein